MSIWLHEDDWGMRALLPVSALQWCSVQFRSRTEWDPPEPLSSLGIGVVQLHAIVGPHLGAETQGVTTGTTSGKADVIGNAAAYGEDLIAVWNESKVVEELFFSIARPETSMIEALAALGRAHPLLYVDWAWKRVARLDDPPIVRAAMTYS